MSLLNSASLICTPNGYKEGTLYSVIPSDGSGDMSVVRATTATRVNSAGLVELVPYNLLQYSEQFNNAYWLKIPTGSATVSVSANSTTAPNDTLTADLVTLTRSSITELSAIIANTAAPLGTYKNSIWIKAKDLSNVGKTIDLWSWEGTTRGYTMITLTAEWVRYEQATTVFSVTATNELFDFGLLPSSFSTSTTTAVEFYVWGGQSVEGTLPKDYQKTETRLNIPRLDYSNGTCPSLLVEPQRTNLNLYTTAFDNADWLKTNLATVTADQTTAPDGTLTADRLNTSNSGSYIFSLNTAFSLSNNNYSFSVYAKAGTQSVFTLGFGTPIGQWFATFNLSTEAVTATGGSTATGKIEDAGDGWYRCILTATLPVLTYCETQIGFTPASGNMFIWGAQTELGSYATSYIPTTSASVTRNADVISKTGISSIFGTSYTIFGDVVNQNVNNTRLLTLKIPSAGLYDNFITIYQNGTALTATGNNASSAEQFTITSGGYSLNQRLKFALRCENNNVAFYINGTQIGVDTSCTIPQVTALYLGNYFDVFGVSVVNSAAAWPTALTNTQLAQLTTI